MIVAGVVAALLLLGCCCGVAYTQLAPKPTPTPTQKVPAPSPDPAKSLVTSLIEARRAGAVTAVRQYTTAHFQRAYKDQWLRGDPVAEFLTSYRITGVQETGDGVVVTVQEDWNSGTETAEYTVIYEGGAPKVDSWSSR